MLHEGAESHFSACCRPPTPGRRRRHPASGGWSFPTHQRTSSEQESRSGSGSQRDSSSSSSSTASTAGEGHEESIIQVVEHAFTPGSAAPGLAGPGSAGPGVNVSQMSVVLWRCPAVSHQAMASWSQLLQHSCVLQPPSSPWTKQHCDCGKLKQPLTELVCPDVSPPPVSPGVFCPCKLEELSVQNPVAGAAVCSGPELCNHHPWFLGGQKSVRTKKSQTLECVRVWPLTSKCAAKLLQLWSTWVCYSRGPPGSESAAAPVNTLSYSSVGLLVLMFLLVLYCSQKNY